MLAEKENSGISRNYYEKFRLVFIGSIKTLEMDKPMYTKINC